MCKVSRIGGLLWKEGRGRELLQMISKSWTGMCLYRASCGLEGRGAVLMETVLRQTEARRKGGAYVDNLLQQSRMINTPACCVSLTSKASRLIHPIIPPHG